MVISDMLEISRWHSKEAGSDHLLYQVLKSQEIDKWTLELECHSGRGIAEAFGRGVVVVVARYGNQQAYDLRLRTKCQERGHEPRWRVELPLRWNP